MTNPRCLLADDHPALRAPSPPTCPRWVHDRWPGRGTAGAPSRLANRERPELALIRLPDAEARGAELILALRIAYRRPGRRLHRRSRPRRSPTRCSRRRGALVLKEAPLRDLVRAPRGCARGGSYLDSCAAGATAPAKRLTQRELDVLERWRKACSMRRSAGGSASAGNGQNPPAQGMDRLGAGTRTQAGRHRAEARLIA